MNDDHNELHASDMGTGSTPIWWAILTFYGGIVR